MSDPRMIERRFFKLRAELTTAKYWLETLIEVSENDRDAEMSWFIPALTLDYHGYYMDRFWENVGDMGDNHDKVEYFQTYTRNIISNLDRRIAATYEQLSYEDWERTQADE